ncbi:MAG: ferritin, partial [Verrucomicrobiota bacterium]
DPKIAEAINVQIGSELFSSNAYLSMAAYFEAESFVGFSKWVPVKSDEERAHAMKIYNNLRDRGGIVKLPGLDAPRSDFSSPLDVFQASLSQEQDVTRGIHSIYKLAHEEADYATVSFLKWFIDEQVEEEKNVSDMIEKLKRAGDNPETMLLLDRYAMERKAESEAD